jgi:hypothetical protein
MTATADYVDASILWSQDLSCAATARQERKAPNVESLLLQGRKVGAAAPAGVRIMVVTVAAQSGTP